MIVLELLVIGGGFGLYFSGVGVIPASILWGAPLLIEVSMLIFICSKEKSARIFSRSLDPSLMKAEDFGLHTSYQFLIKQNILRLETNSSAREQGVFLDKEKRKYSDFMIPINGKAFLNPGSPGRQGPYVGNAVTENDEDYYNASKTFDGIIIAEGPQVEDGDSEQRFFAMIQKSGAQTVVMATNCFEQRTKKLATSETQVCKAYWEDRIVKDFSVVEGSGLTVRSFSIKGHAITQFHIKGWSHIKPGDPNQIYVCTNVCLNKEKIVVHDDLGLGRAGVFAICLMLHRIHNAAKRSGLRATIDLENLILTMRYDSTYGRHGLIDRKEQFDTIIDFAEYLHNQH